MINKSAQDILDNLSTPLDSHVHNDLIRKVHELKKELNAVDDCQIDRVKKLNVLRLESSNTMLYGQDIERWDLGGQRRSKEDGFKKFLLGIIESYNILLK